MAEYEALTKPNPACGKPLLTPDGGYCDRRSGHEGAHWVSTPNYSGGVDIVTDQAQEARAICKPTNITR